MSRPLCIYHANCADGFAAAWVVWNYYGWDVDLHPASYGDTPPDCEDRDVIMVDFSYKRPILGVIAQQANSLLILDHHKTAAEDLADFDVGNTRIVFDMNKSGAVLAWEEYNPGTRPPMLIRHIQDRDLWRFELHGSREVHLGLMARERTMDRWHVLMRSASCLRELEHDGCAIKAHQDMCIADAIRDGRHMLTVGGVEVPAITCPYQWSSEAGNILAVDHPFAACYGRTVRGDWAFSLRSDEAGMDVSTIAAQYGGGGHKHAAGFRVSRLSELETN